MICRRILAAQPTVLLTVMIFITKGYKARSAERKGTWVEVQEKLGIASQKRLLGEYPEDSEHLQQQMVTRETVVLFLPGKLIVDSVP